MSNQERRERGQQVYAQEHLIKDITKNSSSRNHALVEGLLAGLLSQRISSGRLFELILNALITLFNHHFFFMVSFSVHLCHHMLGEVNLGQYAIKKVPVGDDHPRLAGTNLTHALYF